MGSQKPTATTRSHARGKPLRARTCLRKGCPRRFQPACWSQRYCQDPECLRELRRWQAARRQRKCRQQPSARHRHAQAEQKRRARRQANPSGSSHKGVAGSCDKGVETAPGDPRAWSRSKTDFRGPLCSRPGCYESPPHSPRCPARYCSDACRRELGRVCDRERKYLMRQRITVQLQRRLEYRATQAKRKRAAHATAAPPAPAPRHGTAGPCDARSRAIALDSCERYPPAHSREEPDHDPQTTARCAADSPAPT